MRQLKEEQNLGLGLIGGLTGMLLGAALWAIITALTQYQIGYMAIGVGFMVGFGVRFLGKGFSQPFGFVGGALSLLGCLLGNLLSVLIFVSREFQISFVDLLLGLDFRLIVEIMRETFQLMDLLFYGIAVYAGYRYAFRQVAQEELLGPTV